MAQIRRSPLALTVLALLTEEPMHAYRMLTLIKQRGKDRVVNVRQRAGIYQTIDRLLRGGLIAIGETERQDNRPERTVYLITPEGAQAAREWIRDMLCATGNEFPEFPVAISHLPALETSDVRSRLDLRATRLESDIAEIDSMLSASSEVPRLFLLEEEYQRVLLVTQLAWVRSVISDIDSGRLAWNDEWLRQIAAQFNPPHTTEG